MMLLWRIVTMKIKKFTFLAVICLTVGLGIYLLRPKPIQSDMAIWVPFGILTDMSEYLTSYYENTDVSSDGIKTPEILHFLQNECGGFSTHVFSQIPFDVPFGTPNNFGVYLCLPKELNSETPTIIAYTTPIEYKKYPHFMAVLFLSGTDLIALRMLDDVYLRKILNKYKTDEAKPPDFYFLLFKNRKGYE
jgi:hypothetical protein